VTTTRAVLVQRGLRLNYLTIGYNSLEAPVALAAGIAAGNGTPMTLDSGRSLTLSGLRRKVVLQDRHCRRMPSQPSPERLHRSRCLGRNLPSGNHHSAKRKATACRAATVASPGSLPTPGEQFLPPPFRTSGAAAITLRRECHASLPAPPGMRYPDIAHQAVTSGAGTEPGRLGSCCCGRAALPSRTCGWR
jgi:hypothetical protein